MLYILYFSFYLLDPIKQTADISQLPQYPCTINICHRPHLSSDYPVWGSGEIDCKKNLPEILLLGLPRRYQPENVENGTYNVSSLIIGPWEVVSYHFSSTLLCCRRPNETSDRRYVDVANVRYNASEIGIKWENKYRIIVTFNLNLNEWFWV